SALQAAPAFFPSITTMRVRNAIHVRNRIIPHSKPEAALVKGRFSVAKISRIRKFYIDIIFSNTMIKWAVAAPANARNRAVDEQ
ncbi:MAG: hypothetical protein AAGU77_13405, partial [Bacillota bacterium]